MIKDKDVADIEDYLKVSPIEDLPEARSSVSYTLNSKDGFNLIFTVRSNDEAELIELMADLEAGFIKRGYGAKNGGVKPVETKPTGVKCPTCGADLVEFETKTGKSGVKCSTAGWDPINKEATGCDYVKWNDTPNDPATPNQIQLLKDKNLWEEGMTKSEASKKISEVLGK